MKMVNLSEMDWDIYLMKAVEQQFVKVNGNMEKKRKEELTCIMVGM